MTAAHRRDVVIETAISVVINMLISIGFVYLSFGGRALIPLRALIPDAAPQSFMIALMSTLVPTVLTRRRKRAGTIERAVDPRSRSPTPLWRRALLAAIAAGSIGVAAQAGGLTLFAPNCLLFSTALIAKAVYGGLLALIVTPVMLRLALAEELP